MTGVVQLEFSIDTWRWWGSKPCSISLADLEMEPTADSRQPTVRRFTISRHIDRFLGWIKWPVALASLALLPGALWALGTVFRLIGDNTVEMLPFLGGFAAYFLVWWLVFRRPSWGSYLSTIEHEGTHALFAVLTFHRVTSLRATWRDGGTIAFRGRGNWLITIAPYFFPTTSILVACVLWLIPTTFLPWVAAILGGTIAFHITSTWLETHFRQPDLAKVRLPFAIMFLPTANAICYALLVAVAAAGSDGMAEYLAALGEKTVELYSSLGELL